MDKQTNELLKLVRDQENLITEYYNLNNDLRRSMNKVYILNWILFVSLGFSISYSFFM